MRTGDWAGLGWDGWGDLAAVRERLAAGADPLAMDSFWGTPLHEAAERGWPEVVAELAARAGEVDVLHEGRTPLWLAVFGERPDNALALAEAGADPWRPMMAGWSPGRLALATPDPDLFGPPPTGVSRYLDEAEALAGAQARELVAVLDDRYFEGASVMCVANVDAAEAIRRLQAEPVEDDGTDEMADILEDPWSYDFEEIGPIVGVSDVPGGCVVTQPWGPRASSPVVGKLLSVGTVGYGVFSNAKSGNQGDIVRDGVLEAWDLRPGSGSVEENASAEEVLLGFLYRHHAFAYAFAYASLRPTDSRPVTGPADVWLRLPDRE
ncbi:ankyrin repeat domain-containing protein [Amycolatopsis sp. NBC_01480]|uniref:ankyrin repeat domain-containing protein n=1 Tax=Amycolatopsis sp. NBC_01480 TaxID=2903562 RepID=UPI002E2BF000|nr:ankyrin repeat domain-containing protein [Amycolatopsis sp. NBC_01480]